MCEVSKRWASYNNPVTPVVIFAIEVMPNEAIKSTAIYEKLDDYERSTNISIESEFNDEDFEDMVQDFQMKSHRSVKISSVGLSAKAKKSLKIQMIKILNKK